MFIANGNFQFKCSIPFCPEYVTVSQSTISESFRLVRCPVGHQLSVATCRVGRSPDGTSQQQNLWPCPTCNQVNTVNWINNPDGVAHGNYRCSFCAIEFRGPQLLVSDRTSISQVPASLQTALQATQHAFSTHNATVLSSSSSPPTFALSWGWWRDDVVEALVLGQCPQQQHPYEIKRCTCGHILSSNSGKCEKCGCSLT